MTPDPLRPTRPGRLAVWLAGSIAVAVLALKAWAVARVAFHWDEFWFLSMAHAAWRGELASGFQAFHAVLFAWLPGLGDEVAQLRAGRWVLWAGLVLSAGLLYALARRWASPGASLFAPAAFLACSPTLAHAGAFRTDSVVLPLVLGAAVWMTAPRGGRTGRAGAGALLGLATLVSIKTLLLAPAVLALLWARPGAGPWPHRLRDAGMVAAWAVLAGLLLFFLPSLLWTFTGSVEAAGGAAAMAGRKVMSGWLPQPGALLATLHADAATWGALMLGAGVALRVRPALAGVVLAFLPVLFYRNAFGYHYVLMLAPACVLVALLVHRCALAMPRLGPWLVLALSALLYSQAALNASRFAQAPSQSEQARVLGVVHQAFPAPVRYLDHSGVVATFPKANGFLSTWGLEDYAAVGRPFMPALRAGAPVPLLLADRDVLTPEGLRHGALLPADQRLVAASYVPFWGPVWVAGQALPEQGTVTLPWPGRYRLEATAPVAVDGVLRAPGETLEVRAGRLRLRVAGAPAGSRLVWATAVPPPSGEAPRGFY